MPIMSCFGSSPATKKGMTVDEFKNWLRGFDKDNDGRISKAELREAIRSIDHVWCGWWKARDGMKIADADRNGCLDNSEFDNLICFAQKRLHMKIILD